MRRHLITQPRRLTIPRTGRFERKFPFLTLLSIAFFSSSIFAQAPLTVGEVTCGPGEKKSGFIRVPAGADGQETMIPVTVIRGSKPGPVLGLMAGVHGCEWASILGLQRINKQLEPKDISGDVILVLIAHVPSFLKRTEYYNPYDWKNLNRQFPGTIDGTMSQRIAYQITTQVIDRCDVFIDHHGGDAEDLAPFVFCTDGGKPKADKTMRELAATYGIELIEKVKAPKGSPPLYGSHTAQMRGKPAITVESGKQGPPKEEDINRIVRGTTNILKYLKMIEGVPEKPAKTIWIKSSADVKSVREGIFYPLAASEQKVSRGQMLGTVTDFFGNTVQEVRAPIAGTVLYIISSPPVNAGETLVSVVAY